MSVIFAHLLTHENKCANRRIFFSGILPDVGRVPAKSQVLPVALVEDLMITLGFKFLHQ